MVHSDVLERLKKSDQNGQAQIDRLIKVNLDLQAENAKLRDALQDLHDWPQKWLDGWGNAMRRAEVMLK